MSDSPPERDLEWTDTGVEGCYRYIVKLYKMVEDYISSEKNNVGKDNEKLTRLTHKTIYNVTQDIENFRFNKAIARIRELTNYASELNVGSDSLKFALQSIIGLLNPMIPHITEEMWQLLGNSNPLINKIWPTSDPNLIKDEFVTIAVQINGKMRTTVDVPSDTTQDVVLEKALSLSSIQRQISDKTQKRLSLYLIR